MKRREKLKYKTPLGLIWLIQLLSVDAVLCTIMREPFSLRRQTLQQNHSHAWNGNRNMHGEFRISSIIIITIRLASHHPKMREHVMIMRIFIWNKKVLFHVCLAASMFFEIHCLEKKWKSQNFLFHDENEIFAIVLFIQLKILWKINCSHSNRLTLFFAADDDGILLFALRKKKKSKIIS